MFRSFAKKTGRWIPRFCAVSSSTRSPPRAVLLNAIASRVRWTERSLNARGRRTWQRSSTRGRQQSWGLIGGMATDSAQLYTFDTLGASAALGLQVKLPEVSSDDGCELPLR